MNRLNYTFFEEFKRLDKLCGQLYGAQNGVTHYIDNMKTVPVNNYRYISGWNSDLKELIRLRHIRNYLAHTEGAFEEENCTQKDIDWVRGFYNRILHQSDPIALLHKNSIIRRPIEKPFYINSQKNYQQNKEIKNFSWKDIFFAISIAAVICIAAVIIISIGIIMYVSL